MRGTKGKKKRSIGGKVGGDLVGRPESPSLWAWKWTEATRVNHLKGLSLGSEHDGCRRHLRLVCVEAAGTGDPRTSPLLHLDRLIHQAFQSDGAQRGEHSISDRAAMFSAHHH